jgi:hypothetical protein
MNIEELDNKAMYLSFDIKNEDKYSDDIVKLSIEFAISVLEEVEGNLSATSIWVNMENKIQELKTYLNEKC